MLSKPGHIRLLFLQLNMDLDLYFINYFLAVTIHFINLVTTIIHHIPSILARSKCDMLRKFNIVV